MTLFDIGYILLLDPLSELRIGAQIIPDSMKNIQTGENSSNFPKFEAFAYNDYSYFIDSTEISSVFRVPKLNYCASICMDGYCQNGQCQCVPGYVLKVIIGA